MYKISTVLLAFLFFFTVRQAKHECKLIKPFLFSFAKVVLKSTFEQI